MSVCDFRFAAPADVAALASLIERAYRSPETAGRWDSESHLLTGPRTSEPEIAALIADRASRFVVAETDGRLVGCALVQLRAAHASPRNGSSRSEAYFGMFATDPSIRSAGLGKAILAEAERVARDLWTAGAMVMTVISIRTALIAWYERRGYRPSGARLPFPFTATSGETRRDFDLVELRKELRSAA